MEPLIHKSILNYAYEAKAQKSKSFIENYNKRIKTQ